MRGALSGFAVIVVIITVGYVLGRTGTLGPSARHVLSRLTFLVGTPALLFTQVMDSSLGDIFSAGLLVTIASTVLMCAIFLVIALFVLRRNVVEAVVGALCSSYANAGNLGIPIATYMLGTAAFLVPIQLFQMVVMAPVALFVMDFQKRRHSHRAQPDPEQAARDRASTLKRRLALLNPISVASLLAIVLALLSLRPPEEVMEPLHLLAHMTVPCALIAFGISIAERGKGEAHPAYRGDVVLIVALKSVLHPIVAGLAAAYLFHLSGASLMMVVMIAAFPTAQNVWVYASQYASVAPRVPGLARDAAMATTVMTLPALLVASWVIL
ncbi:AEC family transporter [Micrococcales bacterium 31B]|nr:AEC family transporter [Micrococcales bacterium 31B]